MIDSRPIDVLIVDLEKVVKLSKKEMEVITDIEKSRRQRKLGAWIGLLLIPNAWKMDVPMSGIISAVVIVHLIHVYIGIRPDDKLIDLLQRYINSDVEAVRQLSDKPKAGESAT